MEKISKILFFFLTYIVVSCSSSEDNSSSEITESNTVNSLELYMSSDGLQLELQSYLQHSTIMVKIEHPMLNFT